MVIPVSSAVPAVVPISAPMLGCDVVPDIGSIAQSTASAPARAAASIDATPVPAVSCVCTWMGKSGNSRRIAPISSVAAAGLSRPAMSLIARTWILCSTSWRTISR
jgi:hypothetical protein